MAYIEERRNSGGDLVGFLVVYRPADTNLRKSRFIAVAKPKPGTVGYGEDDEHPWTRADLEEAARARAESIAEEMRQKERAHRKPLERVARWVKEDGWEPIFGAREAEPGNLFANYLRTMIERDRGLRKSTRELYLRNIRVHLDGTQLAVTDIREVTPEMLSDFWAGLPDGAVGAQRNVHQLLSKALNRALLTGLINVNPLKRAPDVKRPPRGRREEVDPLTAEQVEALADAAKYTRDRLEILVMAYGGLRAGEVGGLRRQDILRKGDRCQLRLRQQVVRVTGEGQYIEELKTKAGKRTVDIPCSLSDELEAFLAENQPADDGRVFHGPNGSMRAHNAILHGVKTAGERAGLPDSFSHQLRHTAVSFWLEDRANPKDIQRMVGHADIRETLQTYGHLFDYGGQALAEGMERRRTKVREANGS